MTEPARIGIILGRIYPTVSLKQLSGILEEAFSRKISADIFIMQEDESFLLHRIPFDSLEGMIFLPYSFSSSEYRDRIQDFLSKNCAKPVVQIGIEQNLFTSVWYSDREEIAEITRHLIQVHHCRNLICLTGPENHPVSLERLAGFRKALADADLPCDQKNILHGDFDLFAAQQLAQEFADGSRSLPDAIVCTNDLMAVSLCKALEFYQIQVPEDVLVTGYEGSPEAVMHKIITYLPAWEQLGRNAMCQLYALLTGEAFVSSQSEAGSLICPCGCEAQIDQQFDFYPSRPEEYDLSVKLLSCTSLEEFTMTVYDLHELFFHPEYAQKEHFCLCLYENWNQENSHSEKMFRMHDHGGYSIFPASEVLPPDFQHSRQPTATFFVSICFQERCFGYSLLQYKGVTDGFRPYYLRFCREISNGLEFLRIRNALESLSYHDYLSQVRDTLTGIYKLNQLPDIWQDYLDDVQSRNEYCFWIALNIVGLYRLAELEGLLCKDKLLVAFAECLQNICSYHEKYFRFDESAFLILGSAPEDSKYPHLLIQNIRQHFEQYQRSRKQIVLPLQAAILSDESIRILTEETVTTAAAALITQAKSSKAVYADHLHDKELKQLRRQIYQNPEQEWSVRICSQIMNISSSYFCKIYQKAFGVTCAYDIRRSKMEHGKYLLLHTADTLQEISKKCGYEYSHFMRTFKKFYRMTPTEYRRGN